jgi:glycerophosphoryl diester phosphodiesterase
LNAPRIVAHRGKHNSAPENSLASVYAAIEAGADAIEVDVHATRDGVVVVLHDATVPGPLLSRRPRIADITHAELAGFPLADGSPVPSLAGVLDAAAGKAHLYVEIKARGIERDVMDTLRSSRCHASVHSFDHRIVRNCAEVAPEIQRGILLESYLMDTAQAMHAARATDVWQQYELVDAGLVGLVHSEGGRVIAWTVNDGGAALELARMGVDAICTDDILLVREALASP